MNADHTPRPTGGWPNDENRPVFNEDSQARGTWWQALGLMTRPAGIWNGRDRIQAQLRVLASLTPMDFARRTDSGTEHLTLDEVVELIRREKNATEVSAPRPPREIETSGWAQMHIALSSPGADTEIPDGPWAGFTRGRAIAWCWNLFEYEPHASVESGSQTHAEALRVLKAGGLPTVFGYPERAAFLEASGHTPESYRKQQEWLRKPPYERGESRFRLG